MENQNRASILQMARGAIQERVDYEVCKAVDNILDLNTDPTAKRKITLIEADGGVWKLEATRNIAGYFEDKLAELIEDGRVVVLR